jgi:hypothetical protein
MNALPRPRSDLLDMTKVLSQEKQEHGIGIRIIIT